MLLSIVSPEKLTSLKNNKIIISVKVPVLEGGYVFGYEDIEEEDTLTHRVPYSNYSIRKYFKLPFSVFLKK